MEVLIKGKICYPTMLCNVVLLYDPDWLQDIFSVREVVTNRKVHVNILYFDIQWHLLEIKTKIRMFRILICVKMQIYNRTVSLKKFQEKYRLWVVTQRKCFYLAKLCSLTQEQFAIHFFTLYVWWCNVSVYFTAP